MAEGRGSSQAAPQQLLEVARRHITTPDAVKYTTDLEGELDSDALLAHKQLIIDFRAIAPSGGIKQSAMKDVLVILGRENECARHLAGQLKGWADDAARSIRAMLRHTAAALCRRAFLLTPHSPTAPLPVSQA